MDKLRILLYKMTAFRNLSRGILTISGQDRHEFLQGLITNDAFLLVSQPAVYACFLSPQGKYLFDFFLSEFDQVIYLDTEASRLEALEKRLNMFKMRADVTIQHRPDLFAFQSYEQNMIPGNMFYHDPRHHDLGIRYIGPEVTSITDNGLCCFEEHRLELGIPDGTRDMIVDKAIPLECGMDELNAIAWEKGCYLGQELTARTKHRGLVRKRLLPIKIQGDTPEFEAEITLEGKPVGSMRSATGDKGIALLRLERIKDIEQGEFAFDCQGSKLSYSVPSWVTLSQES